MNDVIAELSERVQRLVDSFRPEFLEEIDLMIQSMLSDADDKLASIENMGIELPEDVMVECDLEGTIQDV